MPPQQLTWTYISDAGVRYVVGLFHSLAEGHLMVYCNQKVVLVDFKVFDTRTYPLFLDDELFKIIIERKGNRFSYGFEIDKQADTPRNKARQAIEKKHWRQTMLFVAALAVFVGLFTYAFLSMRGPDIGEQVARAELIKYHGDETAATVQLVYEVDGQPQLRYAFSVNGQQYEGRTKLEAPPTLLRNGWPINKGDEFRVRYVSDNPKLSELQLQQPTDTQLQRYRKLALSKHLQLHPELTEQQARCLLQLAYKAKAAQGLADFYFQETPEQENVQANSLTYRRLVRSLDFRKDAEQQCW